MSASEIVGSTSSRNLQTPDLATSPLWFEAEDARRRSNRSRSPPARSRGASDSSESNPPHFPQIVVGSSSFDSVAHDWQRKRVFTSARPCQFQDLVVHTCCRHRRPLDL